MKEKRNKYHLTDSFVERCIKALAFYDVIDEIERKECETEEEANLRAHEIFNEKKKYYEQIFNQSK